jgi:site-specific recombinase
VALVGVTNLAVSFSLALWVALRSRGVKFTRSGELLQLLAERFRSAPLRFFVPPGSQPGGTGTGIR